MSAIVQAADGFVPEIGDNVFLAEGAIIVGKVRLGAGANVWYGAILRADAGPIRVGANSSIQDRCILRPARDNSLEIGASTSIAEGCILRGARIGDGVLIGPGSVIMEGVQIGDGCIIAAGSLVLRGTIIVKNSLVRGRPAKVQRPLSEDEESVGRANADEQARLVQLHRSY